MIFLQLILGLMLITILFLIFSFIFQETSLKIQAFILNNRLVYLKDHDGDVTLSIAKPTTFGYVAYRYPFSRTRQVLLKPDGTIDGNSYVRSWKSYDGKPLYVEVKKEDENE